MDFLPREQIINTLKEPLQSYISKYGIDDIGIFEEEGQDSQYYMGYTVKKAGKTYHIHSPYIKNSSGGLAPAKIEWTVETDEPQGEDRKGYNNLNQAFLEI